MANEVSQTSPVSPFQVSPGNEVERHMSSGYLGDQW